MKEVEVCLNDKDWIPVNRNCVDYIYTDTFLRLITIVDEMAELTMHSDLKTAEAKEENQQKDEVVSILQSIAQLGRSAGIHIMIATQKPNASVINTILRSNPLSLDTLVEIKSFGKIKQIPLEKVKKGTLIRGTDYKFHKVLDVTEVKMPLRMFKLHFTEGYIKCSDTHQWTYYMNGNDYLTDTLDLFENQEWFIKNSVSFGKKDGAKLINVEEIVPELCKCIVTNTDNGLFAVFGKDEDSVFEVK